MVEQDCALAGRMAATLAAEPGIKIVNVVALNQVIVRFGEGEGSDALTLATVDEVQRRAVCFVGPSQWRGQWVMRISVSSLATTEADADLSCQSIIAAWRSVSGQAA